MRARMEDKQTDTKEEEVYVRKDVKRGNRPLWLSTEKKYLIICKYAIFVIACGALIVVLINRWNQTKAFIGNLFDVLSPFLVALLIAYFISPLAEQIQRLITWLIHRGQKEAVIPKQDQPETAAAPEVSGDPKSHREKIHMADLRKAEQLMMEKARRRHQSKREKRLKYLSIVLAYVIVITFISIAFKFVIPQLAGSITELTGNIPSMYNKIYDLLTQLQVKYPDLDMNFITQKLNDMVPELVNFGTNMVGNIVPLLFNVSVSLVRGAINAILAVMISVYMISGKPGFKYQFKRLVYAIFEEKKGDAVCSTLRECNDIFSSFLIGKALDSLIIGCLCCVIMMFLRLPYAVLLSVVVGITNMIPYFGPFIGAVPGTLIYLCTSPKDAVVFVIMIFVLQQFDGLVLGPRILGQSTGLSPLWVIFAITVGGAYFGVLGMFVGVPVVAVIAFLINKLIKYRIGDKEIRALEAYKED